MNFQMFKLDLEKAEDPEEKERSERHRRKGKIYPSECRVPKKSEIRKAFLGEQCKEIEENNRVVKTRDLIKEIGDTMGTFHAR